MNLKGYEGIYWSSSNYGEDTASYLDFSSWSLGMYDFAYDNGISIRCMMNDPKTITFDTNG
jgi:hypothetical protein